MFKNGFESISELSVAIFEDHPHLIELYEFTWKLANDHIARKDGLPSSSFMDEGFEEDKVWVWDTCFMALFCRFAHDLFPGIESLDNFYARQRDDGYELLIESDCALQLNFISGDVNKECVFEK